ncbi:MAG: hypothetical protein FJW36_08310 [Acidobacteria bacterium]|nr:hypothetical protein [Acidobacteriota bacterium]
MKLKQVALSVCLGVGCVIAYQSAAEQVKLTPAKIQSMIQGMLGSSGNLQTPYLSRDTVAAYKALPDGTKVEVVKASIEMAKAVMRSPEFQAIEEKRVKDQFNGVNHKIALPATVNSKRQVWANAAGEAYRRPYVDSMKQGLQGDLRGLEYQIKEGMKPMAGEPPHEKVVEEIKKLLALPNGDLAGFQKAYAVFLVMRKGGPTDPVEVEKLIREEQQKNWNEYAFEPRLKKGLGEFVTMAAKVNFAAATKTDPTGRTVFVDPAMQRVGGVTKFLFRMGKAPTMAAVEAAKALQAELK